jgi:hypothetical protein
MSEAVRPSSPPLPPSSHLVIDAFGDDVGALVDIHFGVVLFGRLPAVGGGPRARRRSATGKRCGGEDEHKHSDKIVGVWGRRRHFALTAISDHQS